MSFVSIVRSVATTVVAASALMAVSEGSMAAPILYDYSFTQSSGDTGSFSGQFTVENGNVLDVTAIGAAFGPTAGMYSGPLYTSDNLFSPTSPYVSTLGITFYVMGGNSIVNLYYNGQSWIAQGAGFVGFGVLSASRYVEPDPQTVPEPAVLGMLGLATLAMAVALKRKEANV